MGAHAIDLTVIQYQNQVCIFYGRNTLCNDNLCGIGDFFPECHTDEGICFGIYGTCLLYTSDAADE